MTISSDRIFLHQFYKNTYKGIKNIYLCGCLLCNINIMNYIEKTYYENALQLCNWSKNKQLPKKILCWKWWWCSLVFTTIIKYLHHLSTYKPLIFYSLSYMNTIFLILRSHLCRNLFFASTSITEFNI